jgi:hypothetical protein
MQTSEKHTISKHDASFNPKVKILEENYLKESYKHLAYV